MASKQTFLPALWSERWMDSYAKLPAVRQKACDEAVIALIKRGSSPGLRVKPIQPDKYYWEARISGGDRVVFRYQESAILFVDVVSHDLIDRYGRR